MGNLARQLGPEVIEQLHRRVVEIAQEKKIASGSTMRIDTTVLDTDIPFPTDSSLLGNGVRVLTRNHEEGRSRGRQGGHAVARPEPIRPAEGAGDCARQPQQDRDRPAKIKKAYRHLLEITNRVVRQAKKFRARLPGASSEAIFRYCTQLCRHLKSFLVYYHGTRTHLHLEKDAPESRPMELPESGRVVAVPQVGGLHHRYERQAA